MTPVHRIGLTIGTFVLILLESMSVRAATPTPTTSLPPPTPPPGSSGMLNNLIQSNEPAITLFPFGQGERAVVLANTGAWATYDLVSGQLQFVTSGQFAPVGYSNVFDPVAVTQPNGQVYVGGVGIRPFRQGGSILLWTSTNGVQWGSEIHVADYACTPPNCHPDGEFPDKPWMDVSKSSGRLWMVWRPVGAPGPGRCVATSLNGTQWSSCVDPSVGGGSAMSVAIDGPNSAMVIWDDAGFVKYSRCTAVGLAVACSQQANLAAYREVNGGKLIPGPPPLQASALFNLAGNDNGEVFAVWGEEAQPIGQQPVRARAVWTRWSGTSWTTPQSL